MRKVLSFSAFLMMGLLVSQILPGAVGEGYTTIKSVSDVLLYICLSFIMINVGREFVMDKTRWKSYAEDYFIAMATAAMPWILIAVYYVFVLLPPEYWHSWEAWKENLLLSRFAAPTSAGILFTMLAALGLKSSWIYKKIQVLAIFDDLDTILLMIPLQIMMVGLRWQLIIIVLVVFVLLSMVMKHKEIDTPLEHKVSTGVSFLFMFLVGMSMPLFVGVDFSETHSGTHSITGSQEMMSWGMIIYHVVIVSLLSNVGKLFPVLFYRDRKLSERLALSIGMFTRGEVGAGIIFIALGYNLGGPALVISVLTLVLNLILTSIFVLWVKNLALRSYNG